MTSTIDLFHLADHTSLMTAEAHECQICHVMRHFFVNRNGSSCCLYCDREASHEVRLGH